MSRVTRYNFAKWVYPDYIILIKHKDKYITYNDDKLICEYIGFYAHDNKKTYQFKKLNKHKISYLILDELDITVLKKFIPNNYNKYVYLVYVRKIIKKIGNKLVKS